MSARRAAAFAACLVMPIANQAVAQTVDADHCWRTEEAAAAQVQTIQTMLMVQALKCQDTYAATVDGYNRFLQNKRQLILSSKHVIEGHFVRSLGANEGAVAATNFQTHLGNRTSSAAIDPERCRQASAMARVAANASDDDLLALGQAIAPGEALNVCPAMAEAPAAVPSGMVIPVWKRAQPMMAPAPVPAMAAVPAVVEPAPAHAPAQLTSEASDPVLADRAVLTPALTTVSAPTPTPIAAPVAAVKPEAAAPIAKVTSSASSSRADQVKALQAAVAALNQVAASLATSAN